MDVFLMVRRQKTTVFLDAKETTTVLEVKKMIEGILKRSPEEQRLYKITKDQPVLLEDSKQLTEYGFTHLTARAQLPEPIGLAFRVGATEEFEQLEIVPVSTPPDLPDVMKSDAIGSQNNAE
jgi:transcription elongation factor B subunit 2